MPKTTSNHRTPRPKAARSPRDEALALLDALPTSMDDPAALLELSVRLEELVARGALPETPEEALEGILAGAEADLAGVTEEIEAELWGSELLGAAALPGLGEEEVEQMVIEGVVPRAASGGTPAALALLVVLASLGRDRLAAAAGDARDRLVAEGVPEPAWGARLGAPAVGPCWSSADIFGEQEMLAATFRYGRKQHALCVLVDHGLGGGVKDCYVAGKIPTLKRQMLAAAEDNPATLFEELAPEEAYRRLREAVARPERPEQFDQVEDVAATRALLRSRIELMAALSEAGRRRPMTRPGKVATR